jgi:hypothetical protein
MISTRSVGLLIDTVVCLTLAKWETVSGQFGGYLTFVLAEAFEDVEQVAHRSRQLVEAGDDDDIARLHFLEHPLQGGPVAVGTALLLAVDPLAAGSFRAESCPLRSCSVVLTRAYPIFI